MIFGIELDCLPEESDDFEEDLDGFEEVFRWNLKRITSWTIYIT